MTRRKPTARQEDAHTSNAPSTTVATTRQQTPTRSLMPARVAFPSESERYKKDALFRSPKTVYHHYANAYAFSLLASKQAWSWPKQRLIDAANEAWGKVRNYNKNKLLDEISRLLETEVVEGESVAAGVSSGQRAPPPPMGYSAAEMNRREMPGEPADLDPFSGDTIARTSMDSGGASSVAGSSTTLVSFPAVPASVPARAAGYESPVNSDAEERPADTTWSPPTPSKNAAAQRQALQDIEEGQKKVDEFKTLHQLASDWGLRTELTNKIQMAQAAIAESQKRLKRLKSAAEAQERFRQKKRRRMMIASGQSTETPLQISEEVMQGNSNFVSVIDAAIEEISEELRDISLKIHANPEVAMQEHQAHHVLTEYLERKGFRVVRGAYELPTAFRADFATGAEAKGRTVAFNSEYDALPDIGHGCGHNLIAVSGVAAAYGVMCAMKAANVSGKVVLFGTPAEERVGGKIKMVSAGAFRKTDACLMVHPAHADGLYGGYLAHVTVNVEYFGKAAHAAAAPWDGANALDAVVLAYNAIGMLRQQAHPMSRISAIITNGGKTVNVTPDYASAKFSIRAQNRFQLLALRQKLTQCLESAASATGCTLKATWEAEYCDVIVNDKLAQQFGKYMMERGVNYLAKHDELKYPKSSTDMGNVSYEVPSIHAIYNIGTECGLHTLGFAEAAKTMQAHKATMRAAKCMALTAMDVLTDSELYHAMNKEFKDVLNAKQ